MSQGRIKNVNRERRLRKRQKKCLSSKISLRVAGCLNWPIGCLLLRESPKNKSNIHTNNSEMSKRNGRSHFYASDSEAKDMSMAGEAIKWYFSYNYSHKYDRENIDHTLYLFKQQIQWEFLHYKNWENFRVKSIVVKLRRSLKSSTLATTIHNL